MTPLSDIQIQVIRSQDQTAETLLQELRQKLSPRGDVVSEAGRQKTIELFGEPLPPREVVRRICQDVRERGLSAVLEYTASLDGADLSAETVRVSASELSDAAKQADPEFIAAVKRIQTNVMEFQTAILPKDTLLTRPQGSGTVVLRQRHLPMRRVGICVPGGAAAYPSTVLMTAVPAQAAGVQEIAVVVPPTPFGAYNTDLLATCHVLGIKEVYRIGGAQAVAALAYGVDGIDRVDKVVGPGNLFVALAKQFVFGDVDIDSIAGPSEVVVVADETANPEFVAADLISQAEHSPGSSILITWHEPLLDAVKTCLTRQLAELDRGDLAGESLRSYGALILVRDTAEAARMTDTLAPEHLHLSVSNADTLLNSIQNAGAIFVGHFTPVAMGDYIAGPSHVLPTGGTARFANGLAATDFLKRSSVIQYDRDSLADDADTVRLLADKEGLTGHSASVDIRLS